MSGLKPNKAVLELYNEILSDIRGDKVRENKSKADKLDYSINIIGNLGEFFRTAKPEVKILLLGSIFPEKIEFDGKNYRTRSYNKLLDVIYQETNRLYGCENKKSSEKSEDSDCVPGASTQP